MQKYTLYTLVDITNSGITNPNSKDILGYNQQQNLNTVIQLIGMRSQPINVSVSVKEAQDIVDLGFGNAFKGLHTVWKMEFNSEHTDVFNKNQNQVHFLETEFEGAVFTSGLTETVNFEKDLFVVFDNETKNTYFKYG